MLTNTEGQHEVMARVPWLVRYSALVFLCTAALAPFPGHEAALGLALVALMIGCFRQPAINCAKIPILWVAVFVAFAVGSAVWSVLPLNTLFGGAQLACIAVSASIIARTLSLPQFLVIAASALRVLLLISLLVAVAVPSVGLVTESYESGSLKGVFNHRNLLAFMAVISLVTSFSVRRLRSARLVALDICLAMTCLLGSQSQSALVVAVVLVVFGAFMHALRRTDTSVRTVLVPAVVTLAAVGVIGAVYSLSSIVASLGRDVTLTGRTLIWEAVLDAAERKPLLGVGWNAAWVDGSVVTNAIWSNTKFPIYQAHNAFIDTFLQLGIVGLVLLVLLSISALVRSAIKALHFETPDTLWPVAISMLVVAASVTESRLVTPIGLLLVFVSYCYSRDTEVVADKALEPRPSWRASRGRELWGTRN